MVSASLYSINPKCIIELEKDIQPTSPESPISLTNSPFYHTRDPTLTVIQRTRLIRPIEGVIAQTIKAPICPHHHLVALGLVHVALSMKSKPIAPKKFLDPSLVHPLIDLIPLARPAIASHLNCSPNLKVHHHRVLSKVESNNLCIGTRAQGGHPKSLEAPTIAHSHVQQRMANRITTHQLKNPLVTIYANVCNI